MLTDHHCDPPPPILPRGEVRLPVQSSRRRHRRPHGGAAGSDRGQREAGEDEEGGVSGTHDITCRRAWSSLLQHKRVVGL